MVKNFQHGMKLNISELLVYVQFGREQSHKHTKIPPLGRIITKKIMPRFQRSGTKKAIWRSFIRYGETWCISKPNILHYALFDDVWDKCTCNHNINFTTWFNRMNLPNDIIALPSHTLHVFRIIYNTQYRGPVVGRVFCNNFSVTTDRFDMWLLLLNCCTGL